MRTITNERGITMKRYVLVLLSFLLFNTPVFPQDDSIKIYPENDYVYYLDTVVEKETEGNWFKVKTGSFNLPFINIDNEEVHKFNQNLEILYYTFYPYAVNHADDEEMYILEAKQFQSEDMVTVLFKFIRYYTYYDNTIETSFTVLPINIDMKDNRILTQQEVLERSGYTMSEMIDYIEKQILLKGYYINETNEFPLELEDEVLLWDKYTEHLELVQRLEYFNGYPNSHLFFDDNGQLNIIVPIQIMRNQFIIHMPVYYESFVMPLKEGTE